MPWSRDKAKGFLRRREIAKVEKYEEPCRLEGWGFLPMAFSTWGSYGPAATTLLQRILRRAAGAEDAESRAGSISEM